MEAGPPLSSAALAEIRDELSALYRELDEAVAVMAPVCQLSGRCCRFKDYGHTLFLSGPEAHLLVADAPQPAGQLDNGESCPWQDARGQCTARDARPVGCRVFFCDTSFENIGAELSETFLARLKELASRHDWLWNYAPLHQHLRQAQIEGRLQIASAGSQIQPEEALIASSDLQTSTAAAVERSGDRTLGR